MVHSTYTIPCEEDWILLCRCAVCLPLYLVPGTHCRAAIVPVTVISSSRDGAPTQPRQESTDVPFHPRYSGTVLFQNKFNGKLAATEYPKVNVRAVPGSPCVQTLTIEAQFYFAMFLVYTIVGAVWGFQCHRNMQDLLPIQVRRDARRDVRHRTNERFLVLPVKSPWLLDHRDGR